MKKKIIISTFNFWNSVNSVPSEPPPQRTWILVTKFLIANSSPSVIEKTHFFPDWASCTAHSRWQGKKWRRPSQQGFNWGRCFAAINLTGSNTSCTTHQKLHRSSFLGETCEYIARISPTASFKNGRWQIRILAIYQLAAERYFKDFLYYFVRGFLSIQYAAQHNPECYLALLGTIKLHAAYTSSEKGTKWLYTKTIKAYGLRHQNKSFSLSLSH